MHFCCQLLYCWNPCWKGEEKRCDSFQEQMEAAYYSKWGQSNELAVVCLIRIQSLLCGCNGGEWCKRRCRHTSCSSIIAVDRYPCIISKMKYRNKVKKCGVGVLATDTIASLMILGKAPPPFTFSPKGSYHLHGIYLILLHMFTKCITTHPCSPTLRSRVAYRICIQLVAAIVFHPYKIFLHPFSDLWFSRCVKFIPYMNCAFSLDIYPARSSRGTNSARTNEWDITAEDAISCLFDEFKCSVYKSGCLDDATEIGS